MKKRIIIIKALILFVIGLFSLHSCCTKKYCIEAMFIFELHDFNPEDVDTIIISKYERGSNFTNSIDSSHILAQKPGAVDYYHIYLDMVDKDHEYIIKIPGAALTYSLGDFKTSTDKCNSCFPYTPKSEYYRHISEYQLNGQAARDFTIKIYK